MKNHDTRYFILLFLICLWFIQGNLFAESYKYKISCLGVRVVDIDIINQFSNATGILTVNANSRFITSIFPFVHNTYVTKYEDGYLPIRYEKHVDQKKYLEERTSTYNRNNKTAVLFDARENTSKKYTIMPESRDFFSALLYLSNHVQDKGDLWLDANRLIWKASYVSVGREILKTPLGKTPAIKLKMTFRKISPEPKENTDMLTNQLVNEDNTLYLWISDDGRNLPLKAKYERKPFPVYWEIVSYHS